MANTLSRTVSDDTLSRIVQIESAGDPDAKAPTSSATGLGQFLSATWLAVVKKHRPDLHEGRTKSEVLALRTDPAINLELLARFTEDNLRILGRAATDADIYLAHFSGVGTAKKLLAADPLAPASSVYSPDAIKANGSILKDKTCGQVRAWAARKMKAAGGTDWVAEFAGAPEAEQEQQHDREGSDIELVQRRLKALGYHEVGDIDGKWGGRTAGAIAAFKNDRHLTGPALIDEDLKQEIDAALAEDWKRPIAEKRRETTAKDIEGKVETVRETWWSRLWAKIMVFIGGGSLTVGTAGEKLEDVRSFIRPAKQIFAAMPWQLWVGAFVLAGVLIWRSQRKAEAATVQLVRDGKLTP